MAKSSNKKTKTRSVLNVKRVSMMTAMMVSCSVIIGFIMTFMFYR